MTQINLLPWREKEREDKKRYFFAAIGIAAISSVLIMVFSHITIEGLIDNQLQRNSKLQNEIKIFDRQITEIAFLEQPRQEGHAPVLPGYMQQIPELLDRRRRVIPLLRRHQPKPIPERRLRVLPAAEDPGRVVWVWGGRAARLNPSA